MPESSTFIFTKGLDSLPSTAIKNLYSFSKGVFLVGFFLCLRLLFSVVSAYTGSLYYFKATINGFHLSFEEAGLWDFNQVFSVYFLFRILLLIFPIVVLWRIRLQKLTSNELIQLGALVCLAHTTGGILPGGIFNDTLGKAFTYLDFPNGSILVLGIAFYVFNLYLIAVIARGMGNFVSNTSLPFFFVGSLIATVITLPSPLLMTELALLFLSSLVCFIPQKAIKSRRYTNPPLDKVLFAVIGVLIFLGLMARLQYQII